MEINKLKSLLDNISREISRSIDFDISVLAILPPQTKDLKILIRINGHQMQQKTIPDSNFQSFHILNGNLLLVSEHSENTIVDKIVESPRRKIQTSVVIPIDNEKLGHGALLLGSYDQRLLSFRRNFKQLDIEVLISRFFNKNVETAEVQRNEDYYKELFLNSIHAYAILDVDGTIISVNQEFEKLSGYSGEEVKNKITINQILQSVESKRKVYEFNDLDNKEFVLLKKNGEECVVNLKSRQLPQSSQFVVNFCEITKYKNYEIELREWGDKISTINKLITEINCNVNLEQLLKTLFTRLNDIFEYDEITIILCEPLSSRVQFFLVEKDKPIKIKIEGTQTRENVIHYLTSTKDDDLSLKELFKVSEIPLKTDFKSWVISKLQDGKNVVGAFVIASSIRDAYSQYHVDVLQGISNQIAISLLKTKLYQRYKEKYTLLHQINEAVNFQLELNKVLQLIIKVARNISHARYCKIQLISNQDNLQQKLTAGFSEELAQKILIAIEQETYLIVEKTKRRFIRSFAVFPIVFKNKPLALLFLYYNKIHHFINSEVELLSLLVNRAAVAIDNARKYRHVKRTMEYLKGVVNCAADAIITISMSDGRINFLNDRARQIFGHNGKAQNVKYLSTVMVNGKDIFTSLQQQLLSSTDSVVIESEVLSSNGLFYPICWSFSLLKDKHNRKIGFLGVGKDIGKRLSEEESIKQKSEELESLIYSVTHNLKTPLVSQQGFITLLHTEYFDKLDWEGQHYLTRIQKNSEYMEHLINDLLLFFKIRKKKEKHEKVDIQEILNSIIDDNRYNNKIEFSISSRLPTISFNREELKIIFTNLISNAIKYTGNTEHPKIEVNCKNKGDYYYFYVKDNGIGIDKKYHQQIFDLFYRLQSVRKIDGTGVGLAIVKRIVENHGGKVGIDSEPGKGTTIYFTIPDKK